MSRVELTRQRRPLSRETRLLLLTILVSLAALWVLARVRFAERPVTPNPITPVLTQLAPPPVFEQLSAAVFQVESRLSPLLMGIDVRRSVSFGDQGPDVVPALRLDRDIALTRCFAPSGISRSAFGRACSMTSVCSRHSNGTCAISAADMA